MNHRYNATATKENGWWVVEVHGVGTTMAKTNTSAKAMARDLVVQMLNVPASQVTVNVDFKG